MTPPNKTAKEKCELCGNRNANCIYDNLRLCNICCKEYIAQIRGCNMKPNKTTNYPLQNKIIEVKGKPNKTAKENRTHAEIALKKAFDKFGDLKELSRTYGDTWTKLVLYRNYLLDEALSAQQKQHEEEIKRLQGELDYAYTQMRLLKSKHEAKLEEARKQMSKAVFLKCRKCGFIAFDVVKHKKCNANDKDWEQIIFYQLKGK
jgi:rubrerythrin